MKTFKLPKHFGENWLTALRSGDYGQGTGYLSAREFDDEDNVIVESEYTYCCLGLGMKICGAEAIEMEGCELPYQIEFTKPEDYPSQLYIESITEQGSFITTNLIDILTYLNDGFNYQKYTEIISIFPELKFSKIPDIELPKNDVRYTFTEIADWIENNIEFV